MGQASAMAMTYNQPNYYICGAYSFQTGKITTLWLVMTVPKDHFGSGEDFNVNGREYILGKREVLKGGEICSYELIKREEVLPI